MKHFLIFFVLFVTSWPALALDVKNVRIGEHPDKTRIVIETSGEVGFKAFTLSNPERLIVDLPLFVWQAGTISNSIPAGILNVRHAVHKPGISRIVFELTQEKSVKAAFKLPPRKNGFSRIVIDLGKGVTTRKEHGTLETANAVSQSGMVATLPVPKPRPSQKPRKKPLIVIDPGHGGQDPGAISPQNFYEKDIVLSLSKELAKELENSGQYRVKMTRDTDKFIRLRDRVKKARDWEADLFISVHADSVNRSNVKGASIYTLSDKASDAQTAALAKRENRSDIIAGFDLSHEDEDVANILIDLARRDTMNQSRFFANLIVDSFNSSGVKLLQNPHRYAGFAVLKAPDIPSVLLEAGFLSNRREAAQLKRRDHRQKIIRSVQRGIDTYFTQLNES